MDVVVRPFSRAEQDMLIGWQDPPAWDPVAGAEATPPGRGNFLVKVGGRPGIPVHVALTETETETETSLDLHDTNRLWYQASHTGRDTTAPAAPEVEPPRNTRDTCNTRDTRSTPAAASAAVLQEQS